MRDALTVWGGGGKHCSKGENTVCQESKDLSFIPFSATGSVRPSVHLSGQQYFLSEMMGLYYMVCKAPHSLKFVESDFLWTMG